MNNKNLNFEEKLNSNYLWLEEIDSHLTEHFIILGFNCPRDFIGIRFFDFLNLDGVDNIMAREIFIALSKFLYPEKELCYYEDFDAYSDNIKDWCMDYSDLSEISVGELLNYEKFNVEEMTYIFDCINESFRHSKEYDQKNKYSHISEIPYLFNE